MKIMLGNLGKGKSLTIIKYAAIFAAFVLVLAITFLMLKKDDPKIPQKEVIINLKIGDKLLNDERK